MANGDLWLSANKNCWPAQLAMEEALVEAVASLGWEVVRAHPYKQNSSMDSWLASQYD